MACDRPNIDARCYCRRSVKMNRLSCLVLYKPSLCRLITINTLCDGHQKEEETEWLTASPCLQPAELKLNLWALGSSYRRHSGRG